MSQDTNNNTNLFSALKRPREVRSHSTAATVSPRSSGYLHSLATDNERLRQKHVRWQRPPPTRIGNETTWLRRGNAAIDGTRRQLPDVYGASTIRWRPRPWSRNDALIDGWESSRISRRDVYCQAELRAEVVCARLAATTIYHPAEQCV